MGLISINFGTLRSIILIILRSIILIILVKGGLNKRPSSDALDVVNLQASKHLPPTPFSLYLLRIKLPPSHLTMPSPQTNAKEDAVKRARARARARADEVSSSGTDPEAESGPCPCPIPDSGADSGTDSGPHPDPADPEWTVDGEPSPSESQSEIQSGSDLETAVDVARGEEKSLAQVIEEHFLEDREYAPSELEPLIESAILRDVRIEGIEKMKEAILESGWVQPSLMIAHDRQDGRPPRLLEGAHRARALIQLYNSPPPLPAPLRPGLRVRVKVLRGLSRVQEVQIARQCNRMHTRNVPMSLVDHVVSMSYALDLCREAAKFPPGKKTVPISLLVHIHPDYCTPRTGQPNVTSSVRNWKRLAEGLGERALKFMRAVHRRSPFVFFRTTKTGLVRQALSTKTLVDSKMLTVLKDYPGAQFWYLHRVLRAEGNEELKNHDAAWCEETARLLKSIAGLCEDFADLVGRKCPRLSWFGRVLTHTVHYGEPKKDPELGNSVRAKVNLDLFKDFVLNYLYKPDNDDEWKEVCALHRGDRRYYSFGLRKLLAETCFEGSQGNVHEALGYTRDVFFEGKRARLREVKGMVLLPDSDEDVLPRKRATATSKSSSKKRREQPPEEEEQQEQAEEEQNEDQPPEVEEEGGGESQKQAEAEVKTPVPQDSEDSEGQIQLAEEDEITPTEPMFKELSIGARFSYPASRKDLPQKLLNTIGAAAKDLLEDVDGAHLRFFIDE